MWTKVVPMESEADPVTDVFKSIVGIDWRVGTWRAADRDIVVGPGYIPPEGSSADNRGRLSSLGS